MTATANIPIIDISGDQHVVAQQLVDAAQEHGFIYIKNLGRDISASSIDGAFALVRLPFKIFTQDILIINFETQYSQRNCSMPP